jgi:CDC-like kinase
MKIIRAVERYVESARTEENILRYLEARDPRGDSKVVRLHDCFERKGNYCMVFERVN